MIIFSKRQSALRRDRLFLSDVIEACNKISRYIEGKSFAEFASDEVLFDATIRNLQNIGEAVRCIPEETRNLSPDVEWKRIVGLRHLLVHQYFGVDPEIVWDLSVNYCPPLQVAVQSILDQLSDESSERRL